MRGSLLEVAVKSASNVTTPTYKSYQMTQTNIRPHSPQHSLMAKHSSSQQKKSLKLLPTERSSVHYFFPRFTVDYEVKIFPTNSASSSGKHNTTTKKKVNIRLVCPFSRCGWSWNKFVPTPNYGTLACFTTSKDYRRRVIYKKKTKTD